MFQRITAVLLLALGFAAPVTAQTPQVLGISSSHDVIDNSLVGNGTFSITATYTQTMNTAINPVFSFPDAGKDLLAVGALAPATALWTDAFTFTQYYDVIDLNQTIGRVSAQVSGGADPASNVPATRVETDLVCLSTNVDVPKVTSIKYYHQYHVIYIEFDISTNFGGLGSSPWSHSDATLHLQFPELGDLSTYFNFQYYWITRYILRVTVTPIQSAEFRDIHAYFEWPIARKDNESACRLKHYWNGDGFDLDHIPPYVTSLTTNLTTVTEANEGTGTFEIVAQYNENVGGNVQFSFPTLNEDPGTILTLLSTVKSNNDSKVTATYSVTDVSTFIPDIDVKVSGATNEPQYNSLHEMQTDQVFADVFTVGTVDLPVALTAFRAVAAKDAIHLVWQTAAEQNNAGFELQRSETGREFEQITFVPGAGAGAHIYQFEDKTVHAGTLYYYRLKQMDHNGAFTYSSIISVSLPEEKLLSGEIFPNPASPHNPVQVNLYLPQESEVTFTVFNLRGAAVHTERRYLFEGPQSLQLHLSELPPGTYFIKVEANGEVIHRKLIIGR